MDKNSEKKPMILIKKIAIIGGSLSLVGVLLFFFFSSSFLTIGEVWGLSSMKEMEVQGGFVYISEDDLTIIDATNPSRPYIFKTIEMKNPQWISYQSGYLFLQEGDGNTQIVDVIDPYHPHLLNPISQAGVLALSNGLLYSINSPNTYKSGTFCVYNFSNPNNPALISEKKNIVDWGKDIKIQGDYGFIIGAEPLLTVVNISNPLDISIISTVYEEGVSRHAGQRIEIINDTAFVSDFYDDLSTIKFFIYAINISNPVVPEIIWKLEIEELENFWVEPDSVYCSSFYDGVLVYDISDLENPVLSTTYKPFYSYITDIIVDHDLVYVLGFITGIYRLQILERSRLVI